MKDFQTYVKVQSSGKYNMLDPMAIKATGLTKEKYFNIIQNYVDYEIKFKNDN